MRIELQQDLQLLKEFCEVAVRLAKSNVEANNIMKQQQPQYNDIWNKNIERHKQRKEIALKLLETATLELKEFERNKIVKDFFEES